MINSVSSYETKTNPFGVVSNRNSNTDFWLKKRELKDDELTINDVLTPEKARKTHNMKAIGISIAGATVATAGAILLLLKGGPKGLGKWIDKLRLHYLQKLQDAKLNDKTSKNTEFILSKLNYFASKGEAVNNFTTMKDYAFKRIMYWLGAPTRKIHQGITDMFEKLGSRTVELSYGKTASKLLNTSAINEKMLNKIGSADLDEIITINGTALKRGEWLEKLKTLTKDVEDTYTFHFGDTRRNMRLDKMRSNAKELENDFNTQGDLWFLSKDTFKTFVAEQKMRANKMHIQIPIKSVRKQISYTKEDLFKESDARIMRITSTLNFGEKDTLNAINKLRNDLKTFAQKDGIVSKEQLMEDIDKFLSEFAKGTDPKNKARMAVFEDINDLKMSIIDFKKGEVEEILDIYKKLLPENEFNQVKESYKKSVKSLDKSINLETEEFVNKLRDLTMGSAPTDIVTILSGLGTLGYYLGKADNKEERTGIALKYGIPALSLIGTCLYGNAKLFAGSKSMALGIAVSWVVNRIGSAANEILMKHYDKKKLLALQNSNTELKQA